MASISCLYSALASFLVWFSVLISILVCPYISPATPRQAINVTLRLANGRNVSEGRVEVLYNDTWGTICDNSWDIQDAEVVCRQLGFESALEAVSNAYFGPGNDTMPIWMSSVVCYGNEATITECLYPGFGVHNCRHREDAGVRCYSEWEKRWVYFIMAPFTHTRTHACTHSPLHPPHTHAQSLMTWFAW